MSLLKKHILSVKFYSDMLLIIKNNINKFLTLIIFALIFLYLIFNQSIISSLLLTTEIIPNFPIKPLSIFGQNIVKENVEFSAQDKKIKAAVYRPDDLKSHPVMIFTVGVGLLGENDELLDRLSRAMAKVGIVSVVPEIPLLAAEYVLKDSIPDFVSTFDYVYDQPYSDKDNVGFAGFCVGGSLSLISAADKRISSKVAYIVLISPYFDNLKTVEAIVTKTDIIDGKQIPWNPDILSVKVAHNGLAAYLENVVERKKLQEALESKVFSESIEDTLSKNAQLIYQTARAGSREEFKEIVSRFPEDGKRDFDLISPKNYIGKLNQKTKLFVLSDKNDSFVPLSETRAFRNAFPNTIYTEIDSFEHVRPSTNLPRLAAIKQFVKLFIFLNSIVDEAG